MTIRHIYQKWKKLTVTDDRLATAYKSEGLVFLLVILAGAVFLSKRRNASDPHSETAAEFHDGYHP